MAEGGALTYKQVIHTLQTALSNTPGVSVKAEDRFLTLVKDGIPEVLLLPDQVTRRLVQRIAHKYGVNIEWFYHPEMIHRGPEGRQ